MQGIVEKEMDFEYLLRPSLVTCDSFDEKRFLRQDFQQWFCPAGVKIGLYQFISTDDLI